ncbi:uncharacterized protein LOC127835291 isoform X3 [Dreissena polymorpha]|uniref:Uncharacterized protein n=1 Tax=Dreissena polymorpha TaxID=45954 RepID=A0A9D4G6Y6_DREPO|nr:uncharacterized protein LOC127835291 isoform X3 [Dreissena polymorpha]KAH3809700.1 hypothetical protein DPMN_138076 [Dreissena polymorpha]
MVVMQFIQATVARQHHQQQTSKTCGQTPCGDDNAKFCCYKNLTRIESGPCCCTDDGASFSYECRSGGSSSGGFPWWGVFLIVPFIIAV